MFISDFNLLGLILLYLVTTPTIMFLCCKIGERGGEGWMNEALWWRKNSTGITTTTERKEED